MFLIMIPISLAASYYFSFTYSNVFPIYFDSLTVCTGYKLENFNLCIYLIDIVRYKDTFKME